jgi:hypothetical protein
MFRNGGDVAPEAFREIAAELQRKSLPINKYRKNSGEGKSQCFGYVRQRNGSYAGSRLNFGRPELYQALLSLASRVLPPDFHWISIQVNENYQTAAHTDKGNRGESAILGFGDYSGGELVIEGTPVDIRHKIVFFDGSKHLHYTLPYTGTRYSIVFHTPDQDFIDIPRYSFVVNEKGDLQLREDLDGVTRIYRRDGLVVFASDNNIPLRQSRKPTLRACIEKPHSS